MGYAFKTVLAHRDNFGGTRPFSSIKYIVLHYTANDGDRALSNAKYFQSAHKPATSAHYFVDDNMIVRSVPDNYTAYSVGGNKYADSVVTGGGRLYGTVTNANSISIEMCDVKKDGKYQATEETMENAADLCRKLMKKYHIGISNVIRHFDVTGKHCPVYFMDLAAWERFKDRLREHRFAAGKVYVAMQPFYLRSSYGMEGANKVPYDMLSPALRKKCRKRFGYAIFRKGKTFRLDRVEYDGYNVWGRIKQGYYVPLIYRGKMRAAPK